MKKDRMDLLFLQIIQETKQILFKCVKIKQKKKKMLPLYIHLYT